MRRIFVLFVDLDIRIKRVLLVAISEIFGHDVEHLVFAWPSSCLSGGLEADGNMPSLVSV